MKNKDQRQWMEKNQLGENRLCLQEDEIDKLHDTSKYLEIYTAGRHRFCVWIRDQYRENQANLKKKPREHKKKVQERKSDHSLLHGLVINNVYIIIIIM